MARKKEESFYQTLGNEIQRKIRPRLGAEGLDLPGVIRKLRQEKGLSGVDFCRKAGDLDPRTLTALEKGRIKNPSIKTLQSVVRGLGITISELFREAEIEQEEYFYVGSQKGAYQIDFPWQGIKVISFTPFMKDFFCGKMIFGPHKRLEQRLLQHRFPLFISILVGRFEITVERKRLLLREGGNLFFNGVLSHSFYNPLERESVFLMITAPSFL